VYGDKQKDCPIERALMSAAVAKNAKAMEALLEETGVLPDGKDCEA
jgi:hypothetical protein